MGTSIINYVGDGLGGRENTTSYYEVELISLLTTQRHPIQYKGASKISLSVNQNTVLLMNIHDVIINNNGGILI